jgi:hypothetical protein
MGVGSALKKSLHASEQLRADVALAREAWRQNQPSLDPGKIVFVDETGTNTAMTRLRGRCKCSERLIGRAPRGHWKTTTFVAGLRNNAITAPYVIDRPMNDEIFLAWLEQALIPTLAKGDIVAMDNLPAHRIASVRRSQPDRNGFRQTQSDAAQGSRANHRRPMGQNRRNPQSFLAQRMRKLLHPCRPWVI